MHSSYYFNTLTVYRLLDLHNAGHRYLFRSRCALHSTQLQAGSRASRAQLPQNPFTSETKEVDSNSYTTRAPSCYPVESRPWKGVFCNMFDAAHGRTVRKPHNKCECTLSTTPTNRRLLFFSFAVLPGSGREPLNISSTRKTSQTMHPRVLRLRLQHVPLGSLARPQDTRTFFSATEFAVRGYFRLN